MKRKIFPKVEQQNDNGVDNYGDVYSFAAARACQVILQLNEQMRHSGIIVEGAISSFPSVGIVEAELLRLRLLGRSHRVLEWNLRDGHGLGLSVRHGFPSLRCIQLSEDDPANRVATSYLYFRIFQRILLTHTWGV